CTNASVHLKSQRTSGLPAEILGRKSSSGYSYWPYSSGYLLLGKWVTTDGAWSLEVLSFSCFYSIEKSILGSAIHPITYLKSIYLRYFLENHITKSINEHSN